MIGEEPVKVGAARQRVRDPVVKGIPHPERTQDPHPGGIGPRQKGPDVACQGEHSRHSVKTAEAGDQYIFAIAAAQDVRPQSADHHVAVRAAGQGIGTVVADQGVVPRAVAQDIGHVVTEDNVVTQALGHVFNAADPRGSIRRVVLQVDRISVV